VGLDTNRRLVRVTRAFILTDSHFGPARNRAGRLGGWLARWQSWPLYWRILIGGVAGIFAGLLLPPIAALVAQLFTRDPQAQASLLATLLSAVELPGKLVLRVLGALAPGLVLLAVIRALMHAELGRNGWRLARLLLLNTVVAILVGLGVANVVRPGAWTELAKPPPAEEVAGASGPLAQFLDNVPKSLLGPLTDDGRVLSVIFLALAFGVALRRLRHHKIGDVDQLTLVAFDALVIVLHWLLELIPLAVFGIVTALIGQGRYHDFVGLGAFVVAVIVALAIQAAYYLVRVRLGSWVRPIALLRGTRDALVMAFSTSSSTATMPVTYACLKDRVGLREQSASMGALVGSNFNNDGTALYEAMAALFIAQSLGQHLSLVSQLIVVLTSIVASVGAAGIPEAGLVTMTLVFNAVGLPPEYIGILLTVDWFLDRCRTTINVMGDMNVACLMEGPTRPPRASEPPPGRPNGPAPPEAELAAAT
jgi:Na+/H+-dicarboxylate symporter